MEEEQPRFKFTDALVSAHAAAPELLTKIAGDVRRITHKPNLQYIGSHERFQYLGTTEDAELGTLHRVKFFYLLEYTRIDMHAPDPIAPAFSFLPSDRFSKTQLSLEQTQHALHYRPNGSLFCIECELTDSEVRRAANNIARVALNTSEKNSFGR